MPEPVEEKYKDLLHPIKDPEKSFAVNISDLLLNYVTNFLEGTIPPNFNSAALVLQGSSSIYGKKVEYLHNLATQLYSNLVKSEKKNDPSKKDPKEKEKNAKEKENKLNDPFFSIEIKPGKNLSCLRKKKSQQQSTKKTQKKADKKYTFVPVDLLPLEGEAKGDVFFDTRGGAIGNKNDYTLNKCRITTSGWLLLPTVNPGMIPTEFSSPDYTLEPDFVFDDESYCSGGADMVDSSPPDEGYPASDGCPSSQQSSQGCSQPVPSQQSDEGFVSVPSSPSEPPTSQPLNTAVQPSESEPMEGVTEGADAATATEDRENVPTGGAGDEVALRRHSLRQALKLCQLEQEAALNTSDENPVEAQIREDEDEAPAVKRVIQKKNVASLPTRLRVPGDELYIQTASEFCARTFFSLDNKVLKNNINKYGVGAFGVNSKMVKRLTNHSDAMRTCRNKKKSNVSQDSLDDEDSLDVLNPSAEVMKADDDSYGNLMGPPLLDDADIVIENDPVMPELPEPENVSAEGIAPVPSTSEEEPVLDDDILYQSFEAHAHEVISNALRGTGVDRNAEISKKVHKWEQTIKPFLEELDKREKFDINVYGSRILDAFEDNNRKQTICFREFCKGKEQWEIHRYFMALLPLVNIGNVSIETEPNAEVEEDIFVTLLSRKMHHKELEAFGHDEGGEHH